MKAEKLQEKLKIQYIMRGYYGQLNILKLENLEKMGRFLESCNLTQLNEMEIESLKLNNLIASKETETAIKNLTENKIPGPKEYIVEFYQTFSEDLRPLLLSSFKTQEFL